MATSVFFGGRRTYRPGIYSQIVNNLGAGGATATGNLAVVGIFPMFPLAEPQTFENRVLFDNATIGLDRDLKLVADLAFNPLSNSNAGISSLTIVNAVDSTKASVTKGSITYKSRLSGAIGNRTALAVTANADDADLFDIEVKYSDRVVESATGVGEGEIASLSITGGGADAWNLLINETYITLQSVTGGVTTNAYQGVRASEPSLKAVLNDIKASAEDAGATVVLELPATDIDCSVIDNLTANNIQTTPASITKDNLSLVEWFEGSRYVEVVRNNSDAPTTFTLERIALSTAGTSDTAITEDTLAEALASIKRLPINTVVLMDDDVNLQLLVRQHCKDAGFEAGYNRNAWFGTSASQTLAGAYAGWSRKLNDMDCAVTPQSIVVGSRTLPPMWTALVLAGMQNATPPATPLTKKSPTRLVVATAENFDREAEADFAISKGLVIMTDPSSTGLSVERSVTTWLEDNNPVWTEVSANESVNQSLRNLRSALISQVGTAITSSKRGDLINATNKELTQQKADGLILDYRNVAVIISGDTASVQYDVSVAQPLNFITLTANVVA